MAHGAAHDAAQNIAASFIAGEDAVGNQKAHGTQMVGDDVVRRFQRTFGIGTGNFGNVGGQITEKVDIIVGVNALQNSGNAFQPHAGINALLLQRNAAAVGQVFKFVENQVPDFNPAVSVFFRGSGQAAPHFRTVVVEDFGTITAGAGVAHLPEVVFGGNADDAVIGQSGNFFPDVARNFVGMENGNGQTIFRQAELFGNQFPGIVDGFFLEVVAKREVSEHFEKRMMADVVADAVQVIVFAAGADGFLGSGRPFVRSGFGAGKNVFELNHARVGKHQGRVIVGNQGRRGDYFVSVLLKII